MRVSKGITYIELIISLFLSTVLISCLLSIYLALQKVHARIIASATLTQNAMYVAHILRSNIHSAGYIGCARLSKQFPLFNHTNYVFSPVNKVTYLQKILTIRQSGLNHGVLTSAMRSESVLYISTHLTIKTGDILLVSNCKSADMFTVKQVELVSNDIQKITAQQALARRYEKNAFISLFENNSYFIADTGRLTRSGSPVYGLYLKNLDQNKVELVEGVDDMQVDLDKGAHIRLYLHSVDHEELKKEWLVYAALRN